MKFISPEQFSDFTYSKRKHFGLFKENNYDIELFGERVDKDYCDLKVYQDLMTFAFIKQNITEGSKILEVGGGQSRIMNYFKNTYECWNVDKLEGFGNGPTKVELSGINLIYDYIGNFNKEIPDNYFDFVFSISALEHTVVGDTNAYKNILVNINQILKPGGYSLHCIDQCVDDIRDYPGCDDLEVWTNPIIEYFFANQKMKNDFIHLLKVMNDNDLFAMSEKYYNDNWQNVTGKTYKEFTMPISYNFLWQKPF